MPGKQQCVEVFLPGYIFANILQTAAISSHYEDGLLYGETASQVVFSVSDSEQDQEKQEDEVIIQHAAVNSKSYSFYNSYGEVNRNKLKILLNNIPDSQNLVGWFVVRNDTRSVMSMREKLVVRQLLDMHKFPNDAMIFLLVTPSSEAHFSTTNLTYKCYLCTKEDSLPKPVKMNIINLGASSLQHRVYVHRSRLLGSKSSPKTDSLKVVQHTLSEKFLAENGSGSVQLADNTYSLFHKTLGIMKKMKNELVATDEGIKRYTRELEEMKQIEVDMT